MEKGQLLISNTLQHFEMTAGDATQICKLPFAVFIAFYGVPHCRHWCKSACSVTGDHGCDRCILTRRYYTSAMELLVQAENVCNPTRQEATFIYGCRVLVSGLCVVLGMRYVHRRFRRWGRLLLMSWRQPHLLGEKRRYDTTKNEVHAE